jgi:hypothetical protein
VDARNYSRLLSSPNSVQQHVLREWRRNDKQIIQRAQDTDSKLQNRNFNRGANRTLLPGAPSNTALDRLAVPKGSSSVVPPLSSIDKLLANPGKVTHQRLCREPYSMLGRASSVRADFGT